MEEHIDDERRRRAADTLERLRAGVKQRQAETATVDSDREDTRLRLVELQKLEYVREPTPVSPRPVVGRLLVFLRKAFFHLAHKWYARPVLHQQNGFNRAAGQLIADLAGRLEHSERRLAELARRVETLEAATGGEVAQEDGDDGPGTAVP